MVISWVSFEYCYFYNGKFFGLWVFEYKIILVMMNVLDNFIKLGEMYFVLLFYGDYLKFIGFIVCFVIFCWILLFIYWFMWNILER